MSSTRTSQNPDQFSQERYMSSPEYAELRGIAGNAVTAKAAILEHPAKRGLIFFLQAISIRDGGLKRLVRELLTMFAERIGTPSMHTAGIQPGRFYTVEQALAIDDEFHLHDGFNPLASRLRSQTTRWDGTGERYELSEPIPAAPLTDAERERFCFTDGLLAKCRAMLIADLERLIVEICINPRMQFEAPGDAETVLGDELQRIDEAFPETRASADYASHICFEDLPGALFEYKRRYEENILREFTMTEIARQVFRTLDFGLQTGKMVVVEGESGIGKTTATKAWCNLHLGEARFVTLSGISNKTTAFRNIARALGLASSYTRTAKEMQARIEGVLQRSRLVLVLDEAHHLFSAAERVYTRPELVDWINTALYNQDVPCALICTPQFKDRLDIVERDTTWNGDQFRRRVSRYWKLPAKPTARDIQAVATKLIPGADAETLKFIEGFARSCKRNLSAVVDAIESAFMLARENGRTVPTFDDVEAATLDFVVPSYQATEPAAPRARGQGRGKRSLMASRQAEPMQAPCTADEQPMQAAPKTARRTNLTGLAPVAPSTDRRGRLTPSSADLMEA